MAKLPALQFYPADWRKDPGVQALDYFDRGVWFEMLCFMHDSEQRGKLLLAGKPISDKALARLLGLDIQALKSVLSRLIEYGVASRDEDGVLVNRRMVRDEEIRKMRTECGKLGGNPNLLNQNPTTQVNQNPTPSSSLSSSASDLNRLIACVHACVREHPDKDARLIEIAVIETMLRRKGSAGEGKAIKSMRYFDEEIGRMVEQGGQLGSKAIDALLQRRREQIGYEAM